MKLLMLKGLPASGKSTFAKDLAQQRDWKRVNKDDLRAMIDGGRHDRNNEKVILETRDLLTQVLLTRFNVVVDDTNLDLKHEVALRKIAEEAGAEFEIKTFDVDVHECIRRDLKRPVSVGKDVIWNMWQKYIIPRVAWPLDRATKPECLIVDIDGTLSDMNGRDPYDASTCEKDLPHYDVIKLVRDFDGPVVFCSGRSDEHREQTQRWLDKYRLTGPLFMRRSDDKRKDWIVKFEVLRDMISPYYNPIAVYDDRDQVVAMWRAQQLRVYQVAEGNF